jgi:hypothetical protein
VLVDRKAGRLNHIDVVSADALGDVNVQFAVGEALNDSLAGLHAERDTDTRRDAKVGRTGDHGQRHGRQGSKHRTSSRAVTPADVASFRHLAPDNRRNLSKMPAERSAHSLRVVAKETAYGF